MIKDNILTYFLYNKYHNCGAEIFKSGTNNTTFVWFMTLIVRGREEQSFYTENTLCLILSIVKNTIYILSLIHI